MEARTALIGATLTAAVSFCVHTFVGGRFAARPLLDSSALPEATIWLNYFTWHVCTVWLAVLTALFACGAAGLVHRDAVILCSILAACISITSVAVTIKARIAIHRFPASYLLAITAVLGLWGAMQL